MRSAPNLIYRLLHKDYPERFAAYSPRSKDFYDLIRSQLPEAWSIQRGEMWFYCSPPLETLPAQGWKIHVSATSGNAREVLGKVASVLFKHSDASFKFAVDSPVLSLLNSKSWPRAASGKFITIYPPNSHRFLGMIEEVANATAGMRGPYILSDHRYKTSRAVFYRYGGMRTHTALNVKGEKIPVLQAPDGTVIPDQRLPYPFLPSWEAPIVFEESSRPGHDTRASVLHGRYTVETAVAFSSAGGVYYACDNRSGKKVVIKEARPCINATTDDYDAIELLKKEYRLLTVVADTGIAPRPIDLFQEWEHWFLVEEFVEGTVMSRHSAAHNILLRTRPAARDYDEWCAVFGRLCTSLLAIINVLHRHNIVFADLSTNNLIVTNDAQQLKVIDFEGAYQPGVDRPSNIFTPGFVSQHRVSGGQARWQDDYYAAGAVLLSYLLPIHGLLHLKPQARKEFLGSICKDAHIPQSIADHIEQLMDHPESASTTWIDTREVAGPASRSACDAPVQTTSQNCQAVLDEIVTHLNHTAEYGRKDRLYPADPRVFSTNPLSLAYGAAGVAYTLYKITGKVPEAAIEWILRHKITAAEYPPGLYVGMSGIAWSLLEIGMRDPAEEILRATFQHPLLRQAADLFHGMAGWGMSVLKFFRETGDEIYLEQAIQAGNELLDSCKSSERGCYWTTAGGECPLGLAHGSSGIGLFLLYLYSVTGEERYLAAGARALDFDLAAGVQTKDGGLSWGESVESRSPLYPYWRFGSAGIGIVTARFHTVIGSSPYRSILQQIFIDADRKYAVFPGRFTGLAGLGEFLLDLHELTGESQYFESANKVAEGIMHFRVARNGTAFPGELSSRLCCDYGTGSAGIALFLNRLLGRQTSDFMLDELLHGSARPHEPGKSGKSFHQDCAESLLARLPNGTAPSLAEPASTEAGLAMALVTAAESD